MVAVTKGKGRDLSASTSSVRVSVLTPVFNEEPVLEDVLRRFQEQQDPGGAIEFLFIDGASTDATKEILLGAAERDPRIRVLDNPHRVTSAGLNVAWPLARGDYIARMDAHAMYPSGYLKVGIERLERGGAAAVSGPQIAVGRDRWSNRVATALSTRLGVGGSNFRTKIDEEMETDSGFTGIWLNETIVRHGGWDTDAYPNEDTELASRIREEGGRLMLVPEMASEYMPRNTLKSLWLQYWRYGRGRGRTARLHPISVRRSHVLTPGLVLTSIASVGPVKPLRAPARVGLLVYLGALLTTAVAARPRRDAPYLPLVLMTMHLSHGCGYLIGLVRPGPVVKARKAD
jgi:succinoglycan biosynthesis protein ExoA